MPEKEDYTLQTVNEVIKMKMRGPQLPVRRSLPRHLSVHPECHAFCTLTRSISRNKPMFMGRGEDTCKHHELERHMQERYRFAPYQFKDQNTVFDKRMQ